MSRFYLSHPVSDFEAWKPIYDADSDRRDAAGLTEVGVYRKVGDENNVLVVFEGDDPSKMSAMLADPAMGEKMKEAGVQSHPDVFVGNKLEA